MKSILAVVLIFGACTAFGQTGGISRVMPPSERARTGIDKLTPAEQTALQDWIIRTADRYARQSPKPAVAKSVPKKLYIDTTRYPTVRRAARVWDQGAPFPSHGHNIIARYRDQSPKLIQLEDKSLWEVSPSEFTAMLLWLPSEQVSLLRSDDPNYPVTMVNTTQGLSVNVKFVSQ